MRWSILGVDGNWAGGREKRKGYIHVVREVKIPHSTTGFRGQVSKVRGFLFEGKVVVPAS